MHRNSCRNKFTDSAIIISIKINFQQRTSIIIISHLQTKTSTGLSVFGVMIQGATRNTTLSVKMGVSGKPWQNNVTKT
jgi:hypothetical protein